MSKAGSVRLGVGGPVGSGKTALVEALCKRMRADYEPAVVTSDIFTREDMEFLVRSEALPADRIVGVQTGGCPHTAIREDASMNLDALDELGRRHQRLDLVFLGSALGWGRRRMLRDDAREWCGAQRGSRRGTPPGTGRRTQLSCGRG